MKRNRPPQRFYDATLAQAEWRVMNGKLGREKDDMEKTRVKRSFEPQRASQRAVCQFVLMAYPKHIKQMAENCCSQKQRTHLRGFSSNHCLLGQSQEEVPGQRLPAVVMASFDGFGAMEERWHAAKATHEHPFVERNISNALGYFWQKHYFKGKAKKIDGITPNKNHEAFTGAVKSYTSRWRITAQI